MTKEGNILDLSYNDIDLGVFRKKLYNYEKGLEKVIFSEIMSDPKKVERYKRNERELKWAIRQKSESMMDHQVIADAVTKQYLKMVCNCIYKK